METAVEEQVVTVQHVCVWSYGLERGRLVARQVGQPYDAEWGRGPAIDAARELMTTALGDLLTIEVEERSASFEGDAMAPVVRLTVHDRWERRGQGWVQTLESAPEDDGEG